jgi:hypothetical protein
MSEIPTLKISTGRPRIQAPTRGRVVLVDAQGYTTAGDTVVPALVHDVVERDLITFVAHDKRGELLRAPGGGLPSARFGESSPGVPAIDCWTYPPYSKLELVEVPDFDPEATEDPLPAVG